MLATHVWACSNTNFDNNAERPIQGARRAEQLASRSDLTWLKEIERDLALVAIPQDKFPRVVMSERLVVAGLSLCLEADIQVFGSPQRRALQARNGLMVAMLALCPIRRRNYAALELNGSLLRQDHSWWVVLERTKSRRRDERPLPSISMMPCAGMF